MKVYLARDTRLGSHIIPEGTKLKEMGDGPSEGLIKYELPTTQHFDGIKTIDLYSVDVLDEELYQKVNGRLPHHR